MRRLLPTLACLSFCAPAFAITGHAPAASGWSAQALVMVVDWRGDLCTGSAIAPDLVLTAAHCVTPWRNDTIRLYQNGQTIGVRGHVVHPQFSSESYARARATADLALLKLAAPLPQMIVPARLAANSRVGVGAKLVIAGFGVSVDGTAIGLGLPRAAMLVVTGKPGLLQIRLVDALTRDKRPGLGACLGDSGAPVFEPGTAAIIGLVSWTTAANDEEGCGGLTGVTPIALYRSWIVNEARRLGSALAP